METVWPPAALGAASGLLPGGEAGFSFSCLVDPRGWRALFDLVESYHSQCQGQWGCKCEGLWCDINVAQPRD